jgi:hypothetical protein
MRLGKIEMAQQQKTRGKAAKKFVSKKGPAKQSAQPTGIGLIFSIIKRSRKGVGTDTLRRKTGFDRIKIFNTINALKRKKMIKSAGRGVYVKA